MVNSEGSCARSWTRTCRALGSVDMPGNFRLRRAPYPRARISLLALASHKPGCCTSLHAFCPMAFTWDFRLTSLKASFDRFDATSSLLSVWDIDSSMILNIDQFRRFRNRVYLRPRPLDTPKHLPERSVSIVRFVFPVFPTDDSGIIRHVFPSLSDES